MEAQPHHMTITPHHIDFSKNLDTIAQTNYIYLRYHEEKDDKRKDYIVVVHFGTLLTSLIFSML